MKKNLIILAVIAVTITALLLVTANHGKNTATNVAGGSDLGVPSEMHGKSAPDFELQDLNGKKVKLSSFRGKAVVLNFWATWCAPCRKEMPWFADLEKQYQPQGVEIIGVDMDEDSNPANVARFAKEVGVNYTILLGNDSVTDAYGAVGGLPVTYYINPDGKIVTQKSGAPANAIEIEENIKAALGKGTATAADGDDGTEQTDAQVNQKIGKPAPEFVLKTLDGKTVKLADYRGKAVLLNFWATWCGPCREEIPWLLDMQKQYQTQGLQILGVATKEDSSPDDIKRSARELGLTYTILLGTDAVEDAYDVDGFPTSVYIDPSGKFVAEVRGVPDDKAEIEGNIKQILHAQNAASLVSAAILPELVGEKR